MKPKLASELETFLSSPPSETTPVLLELARRQASRRRPAEILAQYERDAFVAPSTLDLRLVHRLDGLALDAASAFEALLHGPVAPLGACSAIAPTSQDRTLSAGRATEVISDPTNVLALECARRLGRDPAASVRLCTVHQVLRAQPIPKNAGFSRHFRLFALAEAGPARPEDGFEVEAIARHVGVFDHVFDASAALGCVFPRRSATVFAADRRKVLAQRLVDRLQSVLPHVELRASHSTPRTTTACGCSLARRRRLAGSHRSATWACSTGWRSSPRTLAYASSPAVLACSSFPCCFAAEASPHHRPAAICSRRSGLRG